MFGTQIGHVSLEIALTGCKSQHGVEHTRKTGEIF
jgi:hypothetical protein